MRECARHTTLDLYAKRVDDEAMVRKLNRLNDLSATRLRQSAEYVQNIGGNYFCAALDVFFQTVWLETQSDIQKWSRAIPPAGIFPPQRVVGGSA